MKVLCLLIFILFSFNACSVKHENVSFEKKSLSNNFNNFTKVNKNIIQLSKKIKNLSKNIDLDEANEVSYEAINYSKYLANKYQVVQPALFHNTLINLGIKEKGYCYDYVNDLLKYLNKKDFKSFYLIKAVANKGEYFEHTSLVITRDDIAFEDSIILDAWRNTGELFFSKVKDDKKYKWKKR